MIVLEDVLRDRGSRYAASAGVVQSRAEIEAFLLALRDRRKFGKATHHSWAAVLSEGGPLKGDDGEAGAGAVILKMLEREGLVDRIVVVTRWYGGVHLGGDRFAHVVTCTRAALAALR
jgi:putative IMPACT (imprinted ancient) family translation regulator